MINIQKIGGYWKFDENNFLINESSWENISEKWKTAVEFSALEIEKFLQENTLQEFSIYLRGSVPKGNAIENISDLDFIILVENKNIFQEKKDEIQEVKNFLLDKFNFLDNVEIWINNFSGIKEDKEIRLHLNQSLYIAGLKAKFEKVAIRNDMEVSLIDLEKRFSWFQSWMKTEVINKGVVKQRCSWISKFVLRSASELASRKSKKYTRDLYFCWENFSEIYPEQEKKMKKVLLLAINPIADKKDIENILKPIFKFIVSKQEKNKNR